MSIARDERRKQAEALAEERAKRTPEQQLARLDGMFGEGQGATKERARLAQQIADAKPKAKVEKKDKADKKAKKDKSDKKAKKPKTK